MAQITQNTNTKANKVYVYTTVVGCSGVFYHTNLNKKFIHLDGHNSIHELG